MYLKRLKLYGVRGFRFDLPRDGEVFPQVTRHRMLLQGGNGSGKTTVLETVSGLWEWFGRMIDKESTSFTFSASSRWSAELNAMELGDFPTAGSSLWVAVGTLNGVETLRRQYPETPLACLRRSGKEYRIELPPGDWETWKVRSQEGVEPLPNVLHFPPEGRSIQHPPRGGARRLDLYEQNWLARFDAECDLDSLLFTIRAKDQGRYDEAIRLFGTLLAPAGKRVAGEDERTGRLLIERFDLDPRPQAHPWTALSSGERQMLQLVVYTVCLLRDHSILLIDEPDLHIHVGMVKQLLDTLLTIVEQRSGQMIVAGHSQQLWDWFGLKAEKTSLGPWRRSTA